jgi:hypothetical protein
VTTHASECFCGCGSRPEGSSRLAANLLGWEMNEQIEELLKTNVMLDASVPDRDLSNQESFLADGRSYWLALRGESHGELLPDRTTKKAAKKWVKFSKKMWKKSPGRGVMEVMSFPESSAAEISTWLLEGTYPAWADEALAEARSAREQD